jgi:hypothetical protein
MQGSSGKKNLLYFLLGLVIVIVVLFTLKEAIKDGQATKQGTEKNR